MDTVSRIDPIEAIMQLAQADGVTPLNKLDAPWFYKIDDHWTIAANGLKKQFMVSPNNCMTVDLPPFHIAVWFNGWLASIFNPMDESFTFVNGECANINTFLIAMENKIQQKILPPREAAE